MSIYEYDEEKHMKQVFEEGWQAGEKEGEARMANLIAALLQDNRQEDLTRITKEKDYLDKLYQEYQL